MSNCKIIGWLNKVKMLNKKHEKHAKLMWGIRFFVIIVLIMPISSVAQDSWPQWRGPTRDGKVQNGQWLTSLDEKHLTTLWRVGLGPSYSGPILSENMVFVTETQNKKYEVVRAFDRQNGQELWKTSWEGKIKVPFFAGKRGAWIRSTPAFDGERLYVSGIRDVLFCLHSEDGRVIWKLDFVDQFSTPLPNFGFVSSPLVIDQHVYVQAGASFVKIDKYTGEVIWRSLEDDGGMYNSAFSSPYLTSIFNQEQILVQTRNVLAGVSLETGNELWSHNVPAFRGMNILTPTIHQNLVFTSSYGGATFGFELNKTENSWNIKEKWKDPAQGYMSSPIIISDHVYLHLRNRRMACFNIKTGKREWITSKRFGEYMSMIAQDNLIIALNDRGVLLLIKANPEEFELLDSRKISDDSTWAHLAVTNNRIWVRELRSLTVFKWELPVDTDLPISTISFSNPEILTQ